MSILIGFYILVSYKSNKSDNRIEFYSSIRHENMNVSNFGNISDIIELWSDIKGSIDCNFSLLKQRFLYTDKHRLMKP